MNKPFFSIVIPTYNRSGFIRKTIESILKQDFSDYEVLVVDDGSTDNTKDVVATFTDKRVQYIHKTNGERGAARNTGAQNARGLYINFIDSDDIVYTHHLSTAHNLIKSSENLMVFHLGYDVRTISGRLIRDSRNIRTINNEIISGNILSCNGVFIRTDIINDNPFNEDRDLASLEDWELWIRLASRFPIIHHNIITSTVVNHDDRSVMTLDSVKIKKKAEKLIHYVLNDKNNQAVYGKKMNRFLASVSTYAALHLALAGVDKKEVLKILYRGILKNPLVTFSKRFLVIIKLLVLK